MRLVGVVNVLVGRLVALKLGQSVLFSVLDGVLDLLGKLGVTLGNADVLNLAFCALIRSVVHWADIVFLLGEAEIVSEGFDVLVVVGLDFGGGVVLVFLRLL